jgi:hypothetical protein
VGTIEQDYLPRTVLREHDSPTSTGSAQQFLTEAARTRARERLPRDPQGRYPPTTRYEFKTEAGRQVAFYPAGDGTWAVKTPTETEARSFTEPQAAWEVARAAFAGC